MTTNSGELWTLFLGPIIGLPLALSYEKAGKDIMSRPRRPPRQRLFPNGRGLHMIWVGVLMAGIALSLQGWVINQGLHWQTIVFNVLCLSQLGHVLAIRSEKQSLFRTGVFSNKPLLGPYWWLCCCSLLLRIFPGCNPFSKQRH